MYISLSPGVFDRYYSALRGLGLTPEVTIPDVQTLIDATDVLNDKQLSLQTHAGDDFNYGAYHKLQEVCHKILLFSWVTHFVDLTKDAPLRGLNFVVSQFFFIKYIEMTISLVQEFWNKTLNENIENCAERILSLPKCMYTSIITEHESLHKKKQFDWTLRGHDPLKRDVYIQ